jgi:hypothetical protein
MTRKEAAERCRKNTLKKNENALFCFVLFCFVLFCFVFLLHFVDFFPERKKQQKQQKNNNNNNNNKKHHKPLQHFLPRTSLDASCLLQHRQLRHTLGRARPLPQTFLRIAENSAVLRGSRKRTDSFQSKRPADYRSWIKKCTTNHSSRSFEHPKHPLAEVTPCWCERP